MGLCSFPIIAISKWPNNIFTKPQVLQRPHPKKPSAVFVIVLAEKSAEGFSV